MSGICGIIHVRNVPSNEKDLLAIHKWNYPYGSSLSDMYVQTNVSLGCFLEHITNAPMPTKSFFSNKNTIAAIDAILYNRDELVLKCPNSISLSDEELLLSYINTHGIQALKDVNGDFAGAIYDTNKVICKNISVFDASERGLLSQNILAQLRNFVEYIVQKVYSNGVLNDQKYINNAVPCQNKYDTPFPIDERHLLGYKRFA